MRNMISATSLVVLLAGFLASGCAYGTRQQNLSARVANELDCPEARARQKYEVKPKDEKIVEYTVEGCGETRLYACASDEGLVSMGDTGCRLVPKAEQMTVALAEDPAEEEEFEPTDEGLGDEGLPDEEPAEEGPDEAEPAAEKPPAEEGAEE